MDPAGFETRVPPRDRTILYWWRPTFWRLDPRPADVDPGTYPLAMGPGQGSATNVPGKGHSNDAGPPRSCGAVAE